MYENNMVKISGTVVGKVTCNSGTNVGKVYAAMIGSVRKSGTFDILPILIPERVLDANTLAEGMHIKVLGWYRSYNQHVGRCTKLILNIVATEIMILDDQVEDSNEVYLNGYICKTSECRKTPLGKVISNAIVAVNRKDGRSDYIPVICWRENARRISESLIGTEVKLLGRVQSREYFKKMDEGKPEKKIAYEVSAYKINLYGNNRTDMKSEF